MPCPLLARLAAGAAGLLLALSAAAQSSPITLLVGYGAGGATDLVARVVGEEMSKTLGRQIIIENVTGASGMLAVTRLLSQPPNGHLIYMGGTDTILVPMLNPKVRLDWDRDLVPIGRTTSVSMVLAVPAKSPYSNLSDLIADLRKTGKGDFTYAIPGIGTMHHLYGALISRQAHISLVPVPYRGGGQMATDLVGGHIDSAMFTLSTAMPFLKDGTMKALSVSDTARAPLLSQVKRIGEEDGFQGTALPLWQGFFLKAGTPDNIVTAYEKALMDALKSQAVRDKMTESGIAVAPMKGAEFRAFIKPQAELYRSIVKTARILLE